MNANLLFNQVLVKTYLARAEKKMKWYGWEDEGANGQGQLCECCVRQALFKGKPKIQDIYILTDRDPSRTCNRCGRQMEVENECGK